MMALARPHTHPSNRTKRRSQDRKDIFKSVLENPFQITWPSVPLNVQNIALARLLAALENFPSRSRASRKFPHNFGGQQESDDITDAVPAHLVIGINAVTTALESQLRLARKHVVVDNSLPKDNHPRLVQSPIAIVFVCSADVDPIALVDHIPYLVAGCNSARNVTHPVKLIPLPKCSEPTISQILDLRRAAVVALRCGSPSLETFHGILDAVPIVSAPWLCPLDTPQLVHTHIKQLRTTAPKNMKAAREQRAKARAAAKKNASASRRKPRLTLSTSESAV